ncbi:MAG: Holliday junction branch migration protein RuvA [Fimbriimonadaceae bacterium]|nr:Holliday junction branch migration protein RuvA [Fimbriimonadaceae bacterium]
MIAHLNGTLTLLREDRAVIECGGVGYLVLLAGATVARLPAVGSPLRLPVYLAVREDAMLLYGFGSDDEKALFEELLTVSGVGPKVAQGAVSAIPPAQLVEALARGDEARLVGLPGVGKKLAQRLIVELSERVGKQAWSVAAGDPAGGAAPAELLEALTGLGFSTVEARRAARAALLHLGDGAALEALLKEALRRLHEG